MALEVELFVHPVGTVCSGGSSGKGKSPKSTEDDEETPEAGVDCAVVGSLPQSGASEISAA